jgi:hypothetical protein
VYPSAREHIDIPVGNIFISSVSFDLSQPIELAGSAFVSSVLWKLAKTKLRSASPPREA